MLGFEVTMVLMGFAEEYLDGQWCCVLVREFAKREGRETHFQNIGLNAMDAAATERV